MSATPPTPAADGHTADGHTGNGDSGSVSAAEGPATDRLAQVVFALLVLACGAAFIVTQRLKHTPTAVQSFELTPFFSPTPIGHIKQEQLSFKLANAEPVTVTIVNSAENTVATLVREYPVARYKQFSLRWNGRTGTARSQTVASGPLGTTIVTPLNAGRPAPAGEYHVRVYLHDQNRSVISPSGFTLVRP